MNAEKIKEVIDFYRNFFEEVDTQKINFPGDKRVSVRDSAMGDVLAHCHGILDEMEVFLEEGRIEKAFRWLGFVQGVLWSSHAYTLNELKEHSRPS